ILTQPSQTVRVLADRTYLITGGQGGLGLKVADWLIANGARNLVLSSRRPITPEVTLQIQAWEKSGVNVTFAQADVTDKAELKTVLDAIAESDCPLAGVLHCAGVLDDGAIAQMDAAQFQRVLAPKVTGAWNLHQLTLDHQLDFFVLFSSAAAMLGSPGQSNHATANAFLDGLAHYRRRSGLTALSINWGAWSEIGAVADYDSVNGELAGLPGVQLIQPDQGIELLERVWNAPAAQVGVVPIQWPRFLSQNSFGRTDPLFEAFRSQLDSQSKQTSKATAKFQLDAVSPEERRSHLDQFVLNSLSQILGFKPSDIDREAGFFDLGMDSLTALEFKHQLQSNLGLSLPSTLAFDYPTVEKLLDYLAESLEIESKSESSDEFESVSEDELAKQLEQKLADLDQILDGGVSHG
ncbi:MAG: beta-ketoacyl reductase, partial [Cyanobacteria bacterium P01_F01_bin.42]